MTSNGPTKSASGGRPVSAIILAAGKGTRMKSDLPKVCHPIGGRAMVCAVLDACLEAGVTQLVPVVGYQKEKVVAAVGEYVKRPGVTLEFAHQDEQHGTGHAVAMARPLFEAMLARGEDREVFVLCGDGPLIRAQTLHTMLERHRSTGAAATLATSVIEDPTGYGRIVRGPGGKFERIVEHKNATEAQRAIREVNPSYYIFGARALFDAVAALKPNQTTGEYYITDVFEIMQRDGKRVEVIDAVPPEDVLSINTPEQLAEVDAIFRARRMGARTGGAAAQNEHRSGKGA